MSDFSRECIYNDFGYYEIKHKPSSDELADYYKNKYFQDYNHGNYKKEYADSEIDFFKLKYIQKEICVNKLLSDSRGKRSLLDIGCGEGWALSVFHERNWNVTGVDYSDFGVSVHNPEFVTNVITGEILESVDRLILQGRKFDCILLDNVLEHLLDPLQLLKKLKILSSEKCILIIEVPNDFSLLQKDLLKRKKISKEHWVVVPDHISYFNKKGLENLCVAAGWIESIALGDFPIDVFLQNELTNYWENPSLGKACHKARIALEELIWSSGAESAIDLFRSFANAGFGRNITGFYKNV